MANALSQRPKVNAVFIASHNDLFGMIDEYVINTDFKDVMFAIAMGKNEEPFHVKDGFFPLWKQVMHYT